MEHEKKGLPTLPNMPLLCWRTQTPIILFTVVVPFNINLAVRVSDLENVDSLPYKLDLREKKQKEIQTDKHAERQTIESEAVLLTKDRMTSWLIWVISRLMQRRWWFQQSSVSCKWPNNHNDEQKTRMHWQYWNLFSSPLQVKLFYVIMCLVMETIALCYLPASL